MRLLAAAVASVGVLADASPERTGTSQPIEIARAGSQPSQPGPAEWFTGTGVKHWHGAAPRTAMTHIAIQEYLDGKVVEWMEKVSDEQYGTPSAASR